MVCLKDWPYAAGNRLNGVGGGLVHTTIVADKQAIAEWVKTIGQAQPVSGLCAGTLLRTRRPATSGGAEGAGCGVEPAQNSPPAEGTAVNCMPWDRSQRQLTSGSA